MIKKLFILPIRAISILAGFIFIVSIPVLLTFNRSNMSIEIHFRSFIKYFITNLNVIHFYEYLVNYFKSNEIHQYLYSIRLLSISLVIVSIFGIVISTIIMMLPGSLRNRLKRFIDFSTTIPELLILFLLQYVMIYVYTTYGIKLFQLYISFNNEPYFVPLIIITFLPTLFLIQFLLREFTLEEQKDYVILARAKGVSLWNIYVKHILRNVFPVFLIHLRTIVWYLLTNVFVIIHVLNMQGIFGIQKYIQSLTGINFILELMLFSIPIAIANLLSYIVSQSVNRKEEI